MPRKQASAPHGRCGSSIRALALLPQTSPGCSRSLNRWTDRHALFEGAGWAGTLQALGGGMGDAWRGEMGKAAASGLS